MKAYDPTNNTWRKRRPIVTGCIDYFYDALLEVAFLSWVANQKHNPGESLHWARGKSMDQADTLVRHLGERGGFDEYEITNEDGQKEIVRIRHSVAVAWRALANLQEELEREEGRPMSKGSRLPAQKTNDPVLSLRYCGLCHNSYVGGSQHTCAKEDMAWAPQPSRCVECQHLLPSHSEMCREGPG